MPHMTATLPNQETLARIKQRAGAISKISPHECRDYSLHRSPLHPGSLILRWLSIDIGDIDHPRQCYEYECFEEDGQPLHCSVFYDSPAEAEAFFQSLTPICKLKDC